MQQELRIICKKRGEIIVDDYSSKMVKIHDDGSRSIDNLSLTKSKVYLKGIFLLRDLRLRASNEVKIGNSENHTEIITSEDLLIHTNYLYLSNCTIQNDSERYNIELLIKKLIGKNFIIKSKTRIKTYDITITDKNDEKYKRDKNKNHYYLVERDKDGYITVTDKDLLRLDLISDLKALREYISKEVEEDTERCMDGYSSQKLASEILKQRLKLEKIQTELNEGKAKLEEMQKEYNGKKRKTKGRIKRQLSNRMIGYYTNNRRNKNEE